jgi:hypothetical protein
VKVQLRDLALAAQPGQMQERLEDSKLVAHRVHVREQENSKLVAQREPGQEQERQQLMGLKLQEQRVLPWAERRCWHYCYVGVD